MTLHYADRLIPFVTTLEQLRALQEMKRISLEIRADTPKLLSDLKMKLDERERIRLQAEVGFKKYQGE